jgi:ABC-type multidrug transport system fused ATPase/permease subunit
MRPFAFESSAPKKSSRGFSLLPKPPTLGRSEAPDEGAAVYVLREKVGSLAWPWTPVSVDGQWTEVSAPDSAKARRWWSRYWRRRHDLANALIQLRGVTKTYGTGSAAFKALKGIDLDIESGEFVAIMGRAARASRRS